MFNLVGIILYEERCCKSLMTPSNNFTWTLLWKTNSRKLERGTTLKRVKTQLSYTPLIIRMNKDFLNYALNTFPRYKPFLLKNKKTFFFFFVNLG